MDEWNKGTRGEWEEEGKKKEEMLTIPIIP